MRRTLTNCSLIKKCVSLGVGEPEQYGGLCNGYQKSELDDEPCEICGKCNLYVSYDDYNEN